LRESLHAPVARQDLVGHYEQLRRDVRSASDRGREGLGLALFLRRGMTAWMQAWPPCPGAVTSQAQGQPATAAPVPPHVRIELATLLAGIILVLQQEEAHHDRYRT
jgi:hypothetical protein